MHLLVAMVVLVEGHILMVELFIHDGDKINALELKEQNWSTVDMLEDQDITIMVVELTTCAFLKWQSI